MKRAVGQCDGNVNDRKTERAFAEIIANADLDRRNEVLRNSSARDLLAEGYATAPRQRLDVKLHIAELTMPARLLLMPRANFRRRADRFLVSDAALLA